MLIRQEHRSDWSDIEAINQAAFGTDVEARLVDSLRENVQPFLSLVAEKDGLVVGHILFTPVSLSGYEDVNILGLAPLAVMPHYQSQGIGSALVRKGIEECKSLGAGAVAVLGHPSYYPKFGFIRSDNYGIKPGYDVPPDTFMLYELVKGYLDGKEGVIRYSDEFSEV